MAGRTRPPKHRPENKRRKHVSAYTGKQTSKHTFHVSSVFILSFSGFILSRMELSTLLVNSLKDQSCHTFKPDLLEINIYFTLVPVKGTVLLYMQYNTITACFWSMAYQ